ncbi:MAG: redox-sensing transcriptional repressor Rex [Clostridia bacterium]|nr:redox-sensing transcriptional repressor Rex [Clostridia bacterium]
MINRDVSPAVVARLSRYYRFLRALKEKGVERVSSAELASMMDLTASQIRQDLNCFGGFGQQGYGYNVEYLFGELRRLLGAEEGYTAVIVGAGNLGAALAHAQTFSRRGVTVTAMFDISPKLIGTRIGDLDVYHDDDFAAFYKKRPFDIAVLCVPKDAAQECADRLSALGVPAFWNFTGIEITVPDGCVVENVHLGDSLLTLSYKLKKRT